jgi:ABC-type nitrate/sulfonate/bicarbonate transport system ATPase subunit
MNISPDNKIILSARGIRKSFEGMPVIEDVSIHLNEGELVSLIGLSGSGKSTIFNIISGLLMPDEGNIVIEGIDFTGKTGRVSYMYQKDLLMNWKKIIDNVSLPFVIKGISKSEARQKAAGYFKVFGLDGFEEKYPFQLSSGMRQRAALMRTYLFSSDIMLLDEPFGALDAITRAKMQDWLMEVLKNIKTSVLFITHDIEEAVYLSDRVYVLSDRPAFVREEIKIKFPRSRSRDLVTTEEFNSLKKHILHLLMTKRK